ncbi:MAG TPA: hypothetical protein VMT24_10395 [Aggregatilineaceae bacterium]|nr:hypothetical protein [Aggregatilineaceae bacterium]
MPDPRGYLLPAEKEILLRRYAPVLVLFPELRERPPYCEDGDAIYTLRGSFHPRTVKFFLAGTNVCYRPKGWRRLIPFGKGRERPFQEAEILGIESAIPESAVDAAVERYGAEPRYAGLIGEALRRAVRLRLLQQQLNEMISGLDLLQPRGDARMQWDTYFDRLATADADTRRSVVYGRAVQGLVPLDDSEPVDAILSRLIEAGEYGPYDVPRNQMALQYWFQYYYNDWANRHEGDWEGITILVELDPWAVQQDRELSEAELLSSVTERDVGYAAHDDGHRRLWELVQKTREGRPIVYVARGSSTSYFGWRLEGYTTSARVAFIEQTLSAVGRILRHQRVLGRRWDSDFEARFTGNDPKNTDWVAADPEPEDILEKENGDPVEELVPPKCRGVRRSPGFDARAGLDSTDYYLETRDLFWLEMVQQYGIRWGEESLLPGSSGPSGTSPARRIKQAKTLLPLVRLELLIERVLGQLREAKSGDGPSDVATILEPLRPPNLRRQGLFPSTIWYQVLSAWAAILGTCPEAWPRGPGPYLRGLQRWQQFRVTDWQEAGLIFTVKSLLAQVRHARKALPKAGIRWDNPFSWTRYTCQADPFQRTAERANPAALFLDTDGMGCGDPGEPPP